MLGRGSYVHADSYGRLHEHSDADANTYRNCPCGKPDCDFHSHVDRDGGTVYTDEHADGRTAHGHADVDAERDRDEQSVRPAEPHSDAGA